MHVYLIKADAKRPMFKIGKANNPVKRMSELQTGCPVDLELIGYVRCKSQMHAGTVERDFHHRFRFMRTRDRGEWFWLNRHDEREMVALMRDGMAKVEEEARAAQLHQEMDSEFRTITGVA